MPKSKTRPARRRSIPEASIIIPVFNKAEYTRKCLAALKKNTAGASYEVVVVDNASTDHTQEVVRAFSGPKQVIVNRDNQGFVNACNQGAAKARGRFLLFLNNDTEVKPGWLTALLGAMQRDAKIGAAGAKLIYPNGTLQEAGGIIFSDGSGWNFGKGENPSDPRFNRQIEVDYCSGACLLVRTVLFRKLQGFDRRYAPAYYEDVDLCFGIRRLGYKVVYVPQSEVIHYEGMTAGTQLTSGLKQFQVINHGKFMEKWREILPGQSVSPSVSGAPPQTADRRAADQRPAGAAKPKTSQPAINILVVDPTLPYYDRQAGSMRLFKIIQLFRAHGCSVTFIAREGIPGDRYTRELEALGVEVHVGDAEKLALLGQNVPLPPLDLKGILAGKFFHYAWLSFYVIAEQYLPDIRRFSPHTEIIIDTVDIHFLREHRHAQLTGSRALAQAAQKTKARELAIYRQADKIINVTPEDTRVLAREGIPAKRMQIIPIIYDVEKNVPGFAQRADILFVANFNHLPNLDAVKYFCSEIFPKILKKLPEVKFYIVGNNPPPAVKKWAGPHVVVTGYVPELKKYLAEARVSVAPLRFGAGMKGKIVEAMSAGLPVVTTSIGAEGMGLQSGKNIFISDQAEAFARQVVQLYTDSEVWQRISRQGREHVRAHFTPQSVEKILAPLFQAARRRRAEALAFYQSDAHLGYVQQMRGRPSAQNRSNVSYELEIITHSKGYHALSNYYRIRDFLLPLGTQRRKVIKSISRMVLKKFFDQQ